jgi:glutaryl-CoA dehydrogenase
MLTTDFFQIEELLTPEQRLITQVVKEFTDKEIKPVIEGYAQRAEFPLQFVKKFGELGAFGTTLPKEYGGGGLDYVSFGLMCQEIERGDSSMRSTVSVQSSLVMWPIFQFGSEEQKRKYLPGLASGEILGCFGLTEPDHGSDPGGLKTYISRTQGGYILNGSKTWISNAPFADIAIVWARNEDGRVQGVIVERGMTGFSTSAIHGKWSLRASSTGDLIFDKVLIPKENILPDAVGLKAALQCLDHARFGVAWGAIGVALDCYETALKYSGERFQFNKPISSFQLIQKKLAEMLTEITKAQLLAWRLGILMNDGRATTTQISMAKRNNVEMALMVARNSRQIMGAMGISDSFPIMRHMMNLEAVMTYEGTHDIHLLILGAEITGNPAFK